MEKRSQDKESIGGKRRALMLDTPIARLIPKMALPTIVAMLISSVYSLADTYFVSSLGTAATAAVGVNTSIDQTITMAGSFLAVGANSYISRLLGGRQNKQASATLSTAFFSAIAFGIIVMVPGLLFTEEIVVFLGATDEAAPFAVDYARYILFAAPYMAASFVLNQCLRSEGSPMFSMLGMGIGGVLNVILDPIFIFTLGMGISGAAIATAISKLVGFAVLIFPYLSRRSVLSLSFKNISFASDILREVTLMGIPSLLRMGLSVAAGILVNNIAGSYSDSALAATSVVTRIMMLPTSATLGFGQGFMPVAGYNWGARRFDRVKSAFRFSSAASLLLIAAVSVLIAVFSEQIILCFTEDDAQLVNIGRLCLISQCVVMPLNAWVIIVNMLYNGLGMPKGAIILGMSRQGFCFIPVILLLPRLFGLDGVIYAQAVADFLSALITVPFAVKAVRAVAKAEKDALSFPGEDGLRHG